MYATQRVQDGLRAVEAVGTREELERFRSSAEQAGTLVAADEPAPAGGGLWRVRAVLWAVAPPTGPVRAGLAQQPEPRPRRDRMEPPAWLTPQLAGRVAGWFGLLAAVAAALWLLARAVSAAADWTADHAAGVVSLLGLAALGGVAWAARKLRRGGRPSCTTTTVHSRKCRH